MFSEEHKQYLKNIKRHKFFIRFTQILIIVLLIGIWQLAADLNLINTFIASSPKEILKTIVSLYSDGSLFHHVGVTLYEVVFSFVVGTVIGILIATLLWRFKFLAKVLDPYLTVLNSLPKVSLGPIIIILAGAGTGSIILMALSIGMFYLIIMVALIMLVIIVKLLSCMI